MTVIRPLNNNVMFQFLEETGGAKGRFHATTKSGIILATGADHQKRNKWGVVLAAGPKTTVKPGEYILIESLMWMEGTEVDGVKMWKTDDTKILAVTDDLNSCDMQ